MTISGSPQRPYGRTNMVTAVSTRLVWWNARHPGVRPSRMKVGVMKPVTTPIVMAMTRNVR